MSIVSLDLMYPEGKKEENKGGRLNYVNKETKKRGEAVQWETHPTDPDTGHRKQ